MRIGGCTANCRWPPPHFSACAKPKHAHSTCQVGHLLPGEDFQARRERPGMNVGKPRQEFQPTLGRHLVVRRHSCSVHQIVHVLRQDLVMVSEALPPAVTVHERLPHPPDRTPAVSLPHGSGADVGLMLTEIVQGRRDKRDVRQLEDIDVRHPITAHAQMVAPLPHARGLHVSRAQHSRWGLCCARTSSSCIHHGPR